MELKTYQLRTLDAFSHWLEVLKEAQNESGTAVEALRRTEVDISILNEVGNYPKTAWKKLKEDGGLAESAGEYVNRTDEAGRPIPHICFKVPTGGGKNLARRRRFGTPPSANRADIMDCAEQGYLQPNPSRPLESGAPVSSNVGAGKWGPRQNVRKG